MAGKQTCELKLSLSAIVLKPSSHTLTSVSHFHSEWALKAAAIEFRHENPAEIETAACSYEFTRMPCLHSIKRVGSALVAACSWKLELLCAGKKTPQLNGEFACPKSN